MSKILSAKVGGKSVTNREWQSSKVEHGTGTCKKVRDMTDAN